MNTNRNMTSSQYEAPLRRSSVAPLPRGASDWGSIAVEAIRVSSQGGNVASHRGYLLIADLSGYTAYLTSTELDHANGVIAGLLDALVARLGDPLHLWRLEGDAVLAYTTDPNFPDGETFLTICEDMYSAFRARRLDIHANSTCECRACAQVPDLDLKIVLHHGSFEEMHVGPMRDISGPDAILVHRMAKTGVRDATNIDSYALISDAAFQEMKSPAGLTPYAETLEHFGEVAMHVHDLAAAFEREREARTRVRLEERDGLWTHRFHLAAPPRIAWEILLAPRNRLKWMELISFTVHSDTERPGPGARFHCVHEIGEFTSFLVDWEPFDYHSLRYINAFHPHLSHYETYELTAMDDGTTEVRYTMGPMFDPEQPESGPFPDEDAQLRDAYKGLMVPWFDKLSKNVAADRSAYA